MPSQKWFIAQTRKDNISMKVNALRKRKWGTKVSKPENYQVLPPKKLSKTALLNNNIIYF